VLKQVAEPLREWQGHQLPLDGTLFDAYLNSSQDALQCLAEDDDTILLPDSDIRLPSPVCWVLRHREASWVPGARAAVTHGALLAENIIVGDETDIRLIDYEHTGIGHILRDFATLEADILIRAMSDISTPLFSELAFVVAQGETESRDMRSTARVDANPKTRKALEVSFELRYLAAEVTRRTTDSDEYMWALLLTTVDWLVRMTPSHPLYERTRLLGAILCSRLEAGKDAWLSMGYPKWLTSKDREAQEREIGKLRQRLALFETERRSYGRDVPPNILQEIALIRQELRRFGLDQ
jgi:hypothetical protein